MKNKMIYQINGDVTTMYDPQGKSFIIDTDQLEKVLLCNWYVEKKGYVRTSSRKFGRVTLHRYLLGTDKPIDHINREKNDNRLSNLRICTVQENNMNRGVFCTNKSGVKGVSTCANEKPAKYKASIGLNGKKIFLGYYKTVEDAKRAYDEKAAELFGEYAPHLNY